MNGIKIIRVFPRRTNATPDDPDVRMRTMAPGLFDRADEVHISVAFSWDIPWAELAAKQWSAVAPVKLSGPAFNEAGGDFIPGMYMKRGYVITSRGCNNHCWFCSVPKREGNLRELPVTDGWIVTDDNILACSERHINSVFEMLKRQPQRPRFVGGLEAGLLNLDMAKKLKQLKPKSLYFAYDTQNDYDPLVTAGRHLRDAGFTMESNILNCYVLTGYKDDTFEKAEKRLKMTIRAGFMPMAMLYRDSTGAHLKEWGKFQREWANKIIVGKKMSEYKY